MFWLDKLEERENDPSANSGDDIVFVHPQSSMEIKKSVATRRRIVINRVKVKLKTKIQKSKQNLTNLIKCDKN